MYGKLYAVGVGPGDPELMTIKAHKVLQAVDVLLVPVAVKGKRSIAKDIVRRAMDKQWQEVELELPMTQDDKLLHDSWEKAAFTVLDLLRDGKDAAFITIGDPSMYATVAYVQDYIRRMEPNVEQVIIPGISAPQVVAAAIGRPLALGEENLLIMPALRDQEDLERALRDFDNIVLMKAGKHIEKIVKALEQVGQKRMTVFVSRCGFEEQFISEDITSLLDKKLDYLSTIVIKRTQGG